MEMSSFQINTDKPRQYWMERHCKQMYIAVKKCFEGALIETREQYIMI